MLNYSGNSFQCPGETFGAFETKSVWFARPPSHLRFQRVKQFIRERLRNVGLHLIPRETVCFSGESIPILILDMQAKFTA